MDEKLQLPIKDYDKNAGGWHFGDRVQRKWLLWGRHLGEDVLVDSGIEVQAIGDGEVVLAEMKLGSEKHRNWGGLVVLKHNKNFQFSICPATAGLGCDRRNFQTYYSIYGHMRDLRVEAGEKVDQGQVLGVIAAGNTPENGWWQKPHLHWAVYTGPWKGNVLPGYWRVERFWKTRMKWWHDPVKFVKEGNGVADDADMRQA